MKLRAFFDESGTWEDPNVKVVALAGCMATEAAWTRFEVDWKGVLSQYGVTRMHMKDWSFGRGEFSGWSREKREQFLRALLDLLCRDVTAFLGAAVAVRDFEALTPEQHARLHDPYFACFQACVHDAVVQTVEEPDGAVVDLVFDEHPRFRGLVLDLYERYRRKLRRGDHLGSLSFAFSSDVPQLQAADLMAYELRLFWQDCRRSGKLEEPKRYPMRQLLAMAPARTLFPPIRSRGAATLAWHTRRRAGLKVLCRTRANRGKARHTALGTYAARIVSINSTLLTPEEEVERVSGGD